MICSRLNAKCQRRWFFYSEVKGLSMSIHHDLTRRQFIKNLGVAGTGFTVGVALSGCSMAPSAAPVRAGFEAVGGSERLVPCAERSSPAAV